MFLHSTHWRGPSPRPDDPARRCSTRIKRSRKGRTIHVFIFTPESLPRSTTTTDKQNDGYRKLPRRSRCCCRASERNSLRGGPARLNHLTKQNQPLDQGVTLTCLHSKD